MPTLAQLTSAVSLLALATSLWLGCYVITRSPRSRLAWNAGFTLGALAAIFFESLLALHPSRLSAWWPGWSLNLTLAIWYHLSLRTLPEARARRQRRFLPLVYGAVAVIDVLIFATNLIMGNVWLGLEVYTRVYPRGPLFPLFPAFLIGMSLLTLYNFWEARQATTNVALRKQLNSLVRGTLLCVFAVVYAMAVVALGLAAPTLPIMLALGLAVGLLGYGIVRYSALVEGRIVRFDFVFSSLLTLAVALVYLGMMWLLRAAYDVAFIAVVFVAAFAILTHSGFEFARRALDQLVLSKTERALRATLRTAAAEVGEREAAGESLRNVLAAVAVSVAARWGVIALRDGDDFVIRASFHSRTVGERLPGEGLDVRELTPLTPDTAAQPLPNLAVIAPLMDEAESLGAILLGQPKGGLTYSEHDLDLVAEAADSLAKLMHGARRQTVHAQEIEERLAAFRERERQLQTEIEALRSPAEGAIRPEHTAEVEDALRRLYDYSYLGEHGLARRIIASPGRARRPTGHLERGKALNTHLIAAVEKLRPAGAEPRELPPREWHPYLVLRDAYLNGHSNREIMARLYVSEATFHRTRRRALRAVTKAVFEMEQPAVLAN